MGKFGLFDTRKDDLAFDLLFKKRKPIVDAVKDMEKAKFPMTVTELLDFKQNAFEIMKTHEKKEALADYFLDSYQRIKIEFDWMVDKTKDLISRGESQGNDFKTLYALRELHQQIKTTLGKMGKLQGDAMNLKDSGTTINAQNVLVMMRGMQDNWFSKNDAELKDGKIIFKDPKPELLDNFSVWKRKREAADKRAKEMIGK